MSTEPDAGTPQNPFRVSAPPDILSLIPHTLGFEPENSLVLMALCGGRLGATLRLDLPPGRGFKSTAAAAYALNACRFMASDPEADGALLALYTDEPWTSPAHPPYRPLVRRLEKEFSTAGIPLRDGWLVGPDLWRNYFCDRPGCCPWPGTPRQQIADSMLNTELIYRGSAVASSLKSAVGDGLPGPWDNQAAVAAAQARFSTRVNGHWNESRQFRGTLLRWVGAADSGNGQPGQANGLRGDPDLAGFLLASLCDRSVRDTLLVLGAAGVPAALEGARANGLMRRQVHAPVFPRPATAGMAGTVAPAVTGAPPDGTAAAAVTGGPEGTDGPAVAGHPAGADATDLFGEEPVQGRPGAGAAAAGNFRDILVGTSSTAPDWPLLDRMYAVFRELVPVAEGDPKAALLSLLAWIEWARGRGSRADVYLRHALQASPDYRLALLLRELLGTGVLPDWARSRAASWPGTADEGGRAG